jgi:hypothetical protein
MGVKRVFCWILWRKLLYGSLYRSATLILDGVDWLSLKMMTISSSQSDYGELSPSRSLTSSSNGRPALDLCGQTESYELFSLSLRIRHEVLRSAVYIRILICHMWIGKETQSQDHKMEHVANIGWAVMCRFSWYRKSDVSWFYFWASKFDPSPLHSSKKSGISFGRCLLISQKLFIVPFND